MADSALISEIEAVGVALLLAMVASLWVTGALSSLMGVQKPVISTYAETDAATGHPKITAVVTNQGDRLLTIDEVTMTAGASRSVRLLGMTSTVGGLPLAEPLPLRVPPGSRAVITVLLSGVGPRDLVEVRLHTTLGTEFIQYLELP